jgi:hypothetical protein
VGNPFYGNPLCAGVIYKLDTAGTETLLYSFTGGVDGAFPNRRCDPGYGRESLRHYKPGGTADYGVVLKLDTAAKSNRGVVFMLNATGVETVLHSFVEAAASTAKALCSSLHRDYLA